MNQTPSRKRWIPLASAGLLATAPLAAGAADDSDGDRWQFAAAVYFFAPAVKGSTASGSDIDVGFDTLLDSLNMTFMGAFEARKGRWSALADMLYLNVGANGGATVPLTGPLGQPLGIDADASLELRGWVLGAVGGYRIYDTSQASVDLIAGLRYLEMKTSFDLGLEGRRLGRAVESDASGVVWDGVIGAKGRANLSGDWFLPFYLDVGTGDSEVTWQALGGVGYRFDWGDVSLAYRYLKWDLGSRSPIDDISFSGPQLTATFRF